MYRGRVGCEYSGGKPMRCMMMREVLFLEASINIGEVSACVWGGTKELSKEF